MRTLRSVLAFPIWLVSIVFGVIGMGLGRLSLGFRWLAKIWSEHVYIVVVWACRWVHGMPTWQLKDLTMINIQPRTKAQIAYADTLPELQRYECNCGNPKCRAKGRILFGPKRAPSEPIGMPPEFLQISLNMERIIKIPPDEMTRMLDAYDTIKAAAKPSEPA